MLQVAYIHKETVDCKPVTKKLTKKEVEYIDSLNWVNQQKALDRKEAKKFFAERRQKL